MWPGAGLGVWSRGPGGTDEGLTGSLVKPPAAVHQGPITNLLVSWTSVSLPDDSGAAVAPT